MAEFTPAGKNKEIRSYKGDTYSYLFRFTENGSDFDLTQLDKIESILFNSSTEVFTHVWENDSGDTITISGASSNEMSGTGDSETMDIAVRSYSHVVKFYFSDGSKQTYVDFNFKTIDEDSSESETSHEWEIDIDTENSTASTEQLTGLYAGAIQAKVDAETAESNAQTSATNAAESEANASDSATAAAESESNASDSATTATNEADRAETEADDAATSAANAEATAEVESEQQIIEAHGYYSKRFSNLEQRIRDLENA